MHNYNLGDKVKHPSDSSPFIVVGIRENEVEIEGDWSGGTHNVTQTGWVKPEVIKPYDYTKVRYYINGTPYMNGVPIK